MNEPLKQPEEQQQEEPEVNPEEAKALEGGWRPKEEWEGNPEDWVDAKNFNFRGELMDRIKDQTRKLHKQDSEIATLKEGFKDFKEHARKMAEAEYKTQIEQLKQVKKQALEENDYDTVVEADEKMADLKESQKEQPKAEEPPSTPEMDPEIRSWLDDNKWYEDDPVMRGAADAVANDVRKENPTGTPKQILDETAKRVRDRFKTKTTNNNPIPDQSSNRRSPGKPVYSKADLNEEQLRIGQRFVKAGAVKSLKEYASQLAEIGELTK